MPPKRLYDPSYLYKSPGHRDYVRRTLRAGNVRPTREWINHLRYDNFDYASIGRIYADLYEMLDEYPPDERDELLRGIMSPSAE